MQFGHLAELLPTHTQIDQLANTASSIEDSFSHELAQRIGRLLAQRGTPSHQQASLLTRLCGLSPSQARRKLQGAAWSFAEVLAVARYANISLDDLSSQALGEDPLTARQSSTWLDVTIRLGSFSGNGEVRLGAMAGDECDRNALVAFQTANGWEVACLKDLDVKGSDESFFLVEEMLVRAPQANVRHIAILDDDHLLAATLTEWFNEAGFKASSFESDALLLAEDLSTFDGFIVDYLLGRNSSQETISAIRREMPTAPILLLTGKLRDGEVSESELLAVLRTSNVTFFEKPVRPGVLAATLLRNFDQLAKSRE